MLPHPGPRALGAGALGLAGLVGTYALGRATRSEGEHGLGNPISDLGRGVSSELQFTKGAGLEALNVFGHHVDLWKTPEGTIFEPHGAMERNGAGFIDAIGRLVHLVPGKQDPDDTRAERPVLHEATVRLTGSGAAVLEFRAETDADFGDEGREAVLAAVFVDGKYSSDVVLMGERSTPYRVNIGPLPAGSHHVELRIAEGSPIEEASAAKISRMRAMRSGQPLTDRYAPIFETRDLGWVGGRTESAYNDSPLLMEPLVTRNPDGTTRIDYHTLYSNEDGGTALAKLVGKYGRSTDYEPSYSVLLDKDGERISERFQTSRHKWVTFDGEHEGDRPVMRIDTDNNLMSAQTRGDGHRWSPASERVRQPNQGPRADRQLMNANPWTWAVMGRELVREGKLGTSNSRLEASQDPRSYVYLTPPDPGDAATGADMVHLTLKDGRELDLDMPKKHGKDAVRALELPKGTSAASVVAVQAAAGEAYTLDRKFQPRELAVRPFPVEVETPQPEPEEPVAEDTPTPPEEPGPVT